MSNEFRQVDLMIGDVRPLSEGGAVAVDSDDSVIGSSEVMKLEDRVR